MNLIKMVSVAVISIAAVIPAHAFTFFHNGILMGTVCRNGAYWTSYPQQYAQPVGTSCPVRNNNGVIIGYGVVTEE